MKKKKSVLKKTYPFLKLVSQQPLSLRKKILKNTNGDKAVYKSLREIAVNTLNGNLKIDRNKLKKADVKYLKNLAREENKTSKCTCNKRKKYIQQGAGILGLLIPAITAIASTFLAKK